MNIVFDVGNVLIQWKPELSVAQDFPVRADALAYLQSVGFDNWNLQQDGGRNFAEGWAALNVAHPGRAQPLADYIARFGTTIQDPIEGTWRLVDQLQRQDHRLFAITNFASETWPVAVQLHPRLCQVFEDVVVSGHERLLKPDARIYHLLLDRNQIDARDCLFIDDNAANISGACAVGMQAHHFTSPQGLEADLKARGLV